MVITLRYDNSLPISINLPDDTDFSLMLDRDYEQRLADAEEGGEVSRHQTAQDFFDGMSREDYNGWHRENRRANSFHSLNFKDASQLAFIEAGFSRIEKEEEAEKVREAVGKLPEKQRKVIASIYFGGRTQEDVAEAEGITQPAVAQRLKSALENLKKVLKGTL